jgi:hypothetical protein
MRFMMIMKADNQFESGQPPDPRLMAAVDQLTQEMSKAGVILFTGGLAPSSQGVRLVASGGKLGVVDGPFAETKELIAGFAIVQARSKEEAVEWGTRFMRMHQEVLGPAWEGISEIRQVFGPEDFA